MIEEGVPGYEPHVHLTGSAGLPQNCDRPADKASRKAMEDPATIKFSGNAAFRAETHARTRRSSQGRARQWSRSFARTSRSLTESAPPASLGRSINTCAPFPRRRWGPIDAPATLPSAAEPLTLFGPPMIRHPCVVLGEHAFGGASPGVSGSATATRSVPRHEG